MSPVLVLLLQRADDEQHADRAWHRMLNWTPAFAPSQLSDQANEALRLTKAGADPVELCKYDEVRLAQVAAEKAERALTESLRKRFRR